MPMVLAQQPCINTIAELNSVMRTEFIRIQNGAPAADMYTYNLCANTFFNAESEALEPLLNNAVFVCGDDGSVRNLCVIVGGSTQVRIQDSPITGYFLQQLTFMGLTFSGFESNSSGSGTSIAALASTTTTATFVDCQWKVRKNSS